MRADLQRLKRDMDSGRSASYIAASASSGTHSSLVGSGSVSSVAAVSPSSRFGRKTWAAAVGGLALLVIAVFMYLQSRPLSPPKVSGYVPVTHDGNQKLLVGTDGARLYLNEVTSRGFRVAHGCSSGGEVAPVPVPAATMSLLAVSPDGST